MTEKIVIILPGPLLPEVYTCLPENVIFHEAVLDQAANMALSYEHDGAEVIISRGGTAWAISQAVNIPVIYAEATSFDIMETLWVIKKSYPGLKRIGIVTFADTNYEISKMGEMMDLSLEHFSYNNQDDLLEVVKRASDMKMDIVVGGALTAKYAMETGIIGVLQNIRKDTITQAILKAKEIIAIRMQDRTKAEQLKAILNFIHEGVISVDSQGIVTLFNQAAENILNVKSHEIIGEPLVAVFPDLNWDEASKYGKYNLNQLVTVSNNQLLANRIPIIIDQKPLGVVSTFQKVDSILKAEERIRKELHSRGLVSRFDFSDIITNSPTMKNLIKLASHYAQTDSTVLITGESGTGKEIMAHSIHSNSSRRKEPFVVINCAAVPDQLLESELFGYEEGAFTGAKKGGKYGVFELAHNGTIFLDEIGDMPISLQSSLLRVIQGKEVMRLGGEKIIPVNVRIIAATNQDLKQAIRLSKFREDLFYRINVLHLNLPPIRERQEDIPLLLKYFTEKYGRQYKKLVHEIPDKLIEKFKKYSWPGNIRELENFSERLVISKEKMSDEEGFIEQFLLETHNGADHSFCLMENDEEDLFAKVRVGQLDQMTDDIIREVYEMTGKNKHQTAQLLGISRTTVWKKLKV